MTTIRLPLPGGRFEDYRVKNAPLAPVAASAQSGNASRIAYSAVHVVADPLADNDPWLDAAIDWDKTIAFRNYIWDLGLGVAEAMDTAQRGMGVDWPTALELIRRSLDAAKDRPGALIASGAGTEQLAADAGVTVDDVIRAYEEQVEAIEALGGRIILMASRALVRAARGPDDYLRVYDRILSQTQGARDHPLARRDVRPGARGLLGLARPHGAAMDTALAVIAANAAKVDGIKISLLSKDKEIAMRRRLPAGVRMYTGDDFNYAELIAGDEHGYSDALLGIFDAIAPAAAAALDRLGAGDEQNFHDILAPTVPLSRHIFKPPTRFYKTGVVFLAYLNGLQDHFAMVGGQQSARSVVHLAELFRLADKARVLRDPELAARRMSQVLAVAGVA